MINYFNKSALNWDSNPEKSERAKALALEIHNLIAGKDYTNALEFGCGTGILSFLLKDDFSQITLMDNSDGMLKEVNKKITKGRIRHFKLVHLDLEKEELHEKFDVIYSLLTMHHIKEIETVIQKFSQMLNNKGILILADLEKEDGSFHSKNESGVQHNGFHCHDLVVVFTKYGLRAQFCKTFYSLKKSHENGIEKEYPLFLIMAEK